MNDQSDDAYDKAITRLLDSPRFGEHMARYWLDLARYADTNGYHIDNERYMWRWRDWVIEAFNKNVPFDRFTIDQLAGDLLPAPTHAQRIATGFNRNHMINFEGGAIPEEYQVQYVVDRVNTTGTVWMGLTVGCAQCHDHKFDPISQREFYQLYAFFNNVSEKGLDGRNGNAEPFLKAPLPPQKRKLAEMHSEANALAVRRSAPLPQLDIEQLEWELQWKKKLSDRWTEVSPNLVDTKKDQGRGQRFVSEIQATTRLRNITAVRLELTPLNGDLAKDQIDSGWNLKEMLRLIVRSSTYRQSSRIAPDQLATDPENRLLSRGPRFRLDAEVIRDTALSLGGLLSDQVGGPSVRPYQPPGLWKEVAYGARYTAQAFEQDKGEANYRRSMYTFWKRQAPPPNMMLFDAPNRETCTARRERTNTPLQALGLLNDQQFVEAARAFAVRILEEAGPRLKDRLNHGFRVATSRAPDATEMDILLDLYGSELHRYSANTEAAQALLAVGEYRPETHFDPSELAAWTIVASTLFNLDETITRQ